jgi:hypothetical protein
MMREQNPCPLIIRVILHFETGFLRALKHRIGNPFLVQSTRALMRKVFLNLGLVVLIVGVVFIPISQSAQTNQGAKYPFVSETDLPLGYNMTTSSFSFYVNLEAGEVYHLDIEPAPGEGYYPSSGGAATLTIIDPQYNAVYSGSSATGAVALQEGYYVDGIDVPGGLLFDFGPFYTSGNYLFVLAARGFYYWIGGNGPMQAKLYEFVATETTSQPYALLLYVGIAITVIGGALMAFAFFYTKSEKIANTPRAECLVRFKENIVVKGGTR